MVVAYPLSTAGVVLGAIRSFKREACRAQGSGEGDTDAGEERRLYQDAHADSLRFELPRADRTRAATYGAYLDSMIYSPSPRA